MPCTVLIPTHNRPILLNRAVASALAACPEGGEVLVVDDASTPPAAEALAGIGDPRLRVIRNDGPRGASGARNHGVAAARHDLVFFLDDDDEILPDYCDRIIASVAKVADYGFAPVALRIGDAPAVFPPAGASGPLGAEAPLRKYLAGLGAGFWIHRAAYLAAGGLDPAQVVDEDTDLCCRLVAAGRRAFRSGTPGTVVSRARTDGAEAGQLTATSNTPMGAACYQRTYLRNWQALAHLRGARWFLLSRYLRRAAKASAVGPALAMLRDERPLWLAAAGYAFLGAKLLSARLRR